MALLPETSAPPVMCRGEGKPPNPRCNCPVLASPRCNSLSRLRWASNLATLPTIRNGNYCLVPVAWSKARPAKCPSCPSHRGEKTEGKHHSPALYRNSYHRFFLKSSNLFNVASQGFRKVPSSRESSLSSLWRSQPVSISTAGFQAPRVKSHLPCYVCKALLSHAYLLAGTKLMWFSL